MSARVHAVVLAGGASKRFGTDKLTTLLDQRTLLDHALAGLPADWPVIMVGPERSAARPVQVVREQPPGAGPAAAIVTGVRAARDDGAELVVVLPGDAPAAGAAARLLVADVLRNGGSAAVGVDATGRDQPLQLAVRGPALVALAAAGDQTDARARDLLALLPGLLRVPLPAGLTADIDTPEDAERWRSRAT